MDESNNQPNQLSSADNIPAIAESTATRSKHIFETAMATKSVKENICLLIDGYYFYKSVKKIRGDTLEKLRSTSSIPLPWRRTSVKLTDIPKEFLDLHDLARPSPAQLRDIAFKIIDEALIKIEKEILTNLPSKDRTFYTTTDDLKMKCDQIAQGIIQESEIGRIAGVLEFNVDIQVGYAMLDAEFYRNELEKRRKSERSSNTPDLQKIKSIRDAMDALESGTLLSKRAFTEDSKKTDAKPFKLPLDEYYKFIQGIAEYNSHKKLPPGHYNFSIDEWGVSNHDKFKEKQVDIGLAVTATERICDNVVDRF